MNGRRSMTSGPSARHAHAMCFDTGRQRSVVVGGSGAQAFADTWEWDGEHWVQVANSGLESTVGASLTFRAGGSVLFGGMSDLGDTPEIRNDTWGWDDGRWTHLQNMGPSPRAFHGAAYDSERRRVVVFGGTNAAIGAPAAGSHLFGDTWELGAPSGPTDEPDVGLTMSVTPHVVGFGHAIAIDFSLAAPQPYPIAITLLVGSAVRFLEIAQMTTQTRVIIVVDNDIVDDAPPFQLKVEAHVDDHVLRQTVSVV